MTDGIPNVVAEGDGSGDIFRGSATYNEIRSPLIEAGDGIACQYQALLAYARLLAARGEPEQAAKFQARAERLQTYFNSDWGVKPGARLYVRGYNARGEALTDFGLENSWFMPMKFIVAPGPMTDRYLDFIAQSVSSPPGKPSNLEAISYLPGVFFPYHRVEDAWKWLEYIIDQPNREYPEISFTIISHVVEGLLGLEPNAPENAFLYCATPAWRDRPPARAEHPCGQPSRRCGSRRPAEIDGGQSLRRWRFNLAGVLLW